MPARVPLEQGPSSRVPLEQGPSSRLRRGPAVDRLADVTEVPERLGSPLTYIGMYRCKTRLFFLLTERTMTGGAHVLTPTLGSIGQWRDRLLSRHIANVAIRDITP